MTVTVNRADLNQVMMGQASFDDLISSGKARFDGNRSGFDHLRSILVPFTPDFEILPGTVAKAASLSRNPSRCRTSWIQWSTDAFLNHSSNDNGIQVEEESGFGVRSGFRLGVPGLRCRSPGEDAVRSDHQCAGDDGDG